MAGKLVVVAESIQEGDVLMGGISSTNPLLFFPHSDCPHGGMPGQQRHSGGHKPYPDPLNQ